MLLFYKILIQFFEKLFLFNKLTIFTNKNLSISSTKLLEILKTFDVYELNRLEKFIQSPYFNANKRLIEVFSFLKPRVHKELSKQKVWTSVYGKGVPYNDQKLRLAFSDILKLTVEYLGYESYKSNEIVKLNTELKVLSERKLEIQYNAKQKQIGKILANSSIRNSDYFYNNFIYERTKYNLKSLFDHKTEFKKSVLHYFDINRNLDSFYLSEKLKWYCYYLTWSRMQSFQDNIEYIDLILKIIDEMQDQAPIILQIYYKIYETTVDLDNHDAYDKLKKLVLDYSHTFEKAEAKSMYESMINFSIRQINKGKTKYHEEVLNLYVSGITTKILLDKHKNLSPTAFRNIVVLGLRLQKFDWVKSFIENQIILIDEKFRDNAYKFNIARFHFYKKEYDKVILVTQEVEFNDPLYAHVSKLMLLLSYYETNDDTALYYFADSFNIYVKRQKGISDRVRKEYQNLIRLTKKLAKARYDKNLLLKLKEEVENTKELASRQWFSEKLKDVK